MLDSLGQVLPHAARAFGDRTALAIEGRTFSFRELDELSSSLAASLVRLGVKPGDRVTLYAPNSWEWIVSYYGALKTGAVINPVNVMLTPAEVAYVTRDCGAKALIGSADKVAPRARGGRQRPHRHRLRRQLRRRSDALQRTRRQAQFLRAGRRQARRPFDHRLHVRHHRPPERRDAIASRGDPQWRHDGAAPFEDAARHGRLRAALPACLRQCRLQRRDDVRPQARLHPRFDPPRFWPASSRIRRRCSRGCRRCTCTCSSIPTSIGSTLPRSVAARLAVRRCRSPRWRRSKSASAAR